MSQNSKEEGSGDKISLAKEKETEITKKYLEGEISLETRDKEIVKVWASTLYSVITILLIGVAGFAGISAFLIVILSEPQQGHFIRHKLLLYFPV